MKLLRSLALGLTLALTLSACGGTASTAAGSTETTSTAEGSAASEGGDTETENTAADVSYALDTSDMFTDRDLSGSYDAGSAVTITLDGDAASCDGDGVDISGSTVTITAEGCYLLSGTLTDGMVIVNADSQAKVQLVLNGVTIHSETSAALYVCQADKVFVTLAEGTENTLSSGEEYVAIDDNNIDAVIFSKDDLTLNGSGSLTIASPSGHGIVSKDDLVLAGGSYTITAASHGLSANDSIRITGSTVTVTAGKDAIQADNSDDAALGYVYIADGAFVLTADGDGISASAALLIEGGTFTVTAGGGSDGAEASGESFEERYDRFQQSGGDRGGQSGGSNGTTASSTSATLTSAISDAAEDTSTSTKGLKAIGDLMITGGTFTIDAADDAVHSNADITVTGGTFQIATGDDGFHADSTLTVTDGTITISTCYEGLEGQTVEVSGGDIQLTATDDGINAAGGNDASGTYGGWNRMDAFDTDSDASILISGGTLVIDAEGDGIDSNGYLTITGGTIYVYGPTYTGNGALDYGISAEITGGVFVALGVSGMAENFTSATQGAIMVTASGTEGSVVQLLDSNGNELLSVTAEKSFGCVQISTPELAQGETYTLVVDGASTEFTLSSLIYSGSSGMTGTGGMNGRGGRW
ncbi:MAG: carbohydrate-binding domain-containing protein [Clostridiales bacterium]|nr:carbohydrate-binding domain-containing protein [Clostridiales bacterium]